MRMLSRFNVFVLFVTFLTTLAVPTARAQEATRPNDATPGLPLTEKVESDDPEAKEEPGADQDDATARLEWQRGAWGVVTPAFRANALKEGKNHSDKKNAPGPKWVSIGPMGADYEQNGSYTGHVRDSGRARTILPHPIDPNIVYFLTSGGGLWRTDDWTAPTTHWTPLTDDLPTTGGGSVAFGANPNTLYLGLGDPYDQILVGGSVVKSKNGGNSWGPMIELGNAVSVRDVKVDTSTNRDIVMVATDNGLFRSADEGATYSAVSLFTNPAPPAPATVASVWSIVRTSAGWLASAQPCNGAASPGLRCAQPTTLFLSTDRGATWTPIPNTANGVNKFGPAGRTTLAVGLPGDSVVYAYSSNVSGIVNGAVTGDTAMQDVYRSADGGKTWVVNNVNATKVPVPATGLTNMNICHAQCWYDQSILVDPRDPARNTVWIGGDTATAQTKDGGATWAPKTWWLYSQIPALPYAHADHHATAFKMTGTPTIILGNDGGLNISTDDGATFSSDKNNGLATHLYYTVAGTPSRPNFVIGGLQDNGTRVRTDNSTTHSQVIGGDGVGAAYSQSNTNTVMGSSQGSGILMNLTNELPTEIQGFISRGTLADNAGAPFATCIIPALNDPTGRVFYHFTGSRIWRTDDGGRVWNRIASATPPVSPGFPPTTGINRTFRSSTSNLAISADRTRIAVGAAGGFLDVSMDGGATWTDVDLVGKGIGYQGFVTSVTWQDNNTLWITSVAQPVGAKRVIKGSVPVGATSWAGATYEVKQNGLPDLPVTRVYFDPRDTARQTIYAATHVGVYRTIDGGANWAPFGNGLPTVRVNDIYMPPDGSFMRIATYGRGIWQLVQLELASTKLTDTEGACDLDGVLDNGETGRLMITLRNQGPNNVGHITLNVTSTNPHISFPSGNTVAFPPVPPNAVTTGFIAVALNGASGVETADFQIAVDSPELGLPSPFNFTTSHFANYDEVVRGGAVESAESQNNGWTVSGTAINPPNDLGWQRREISPTQHVWFGPDNNGRNEDVRPFLDLSEQILTSPDMTVGSGNFTIAFRHRYIFESGGWDGGIVEISKDGGATWTNLPAAAYGTGKTNNSTNAKIGKNTPAFVNTSAGWPNFVPFSFNLGTAYQNQTVKIRFRIGSDEFTGAPGWDVDDITVGGTTDTPFTAFVPETSTCSSPTLTTN